MMSFAHEMSCECTKSELDLFSVPPTQTSMEQGSWVKYHPISGTGEDYIDFGNTMLYVKASDCARRYEPACRCGFWSGQPVSAEPVFTVGHFVEWYADNCFDQHVSVQSHDGNAVELRRRHGEDAKSSQLTSALYYKDQPGRMDSVDFADNASNSGLAKRRAIARQSHVFDMMGRIHADIFLSLIHI